MSCTYIFIKVNKISFNNLNKIILILIHYLISNKTIIHAFHFSFSNEQVPFMCLKMIYYPWGSAFVKNEPMFLEVLTPGIQDFSCPAMSLTNAQLFSRMKFTSNFETTYKNNILSLLLDP